MRSQSQLCLLLLYVLPLEATSPRGNEATRQRALEATRLRGTSVVDKSSADAQEDYSERIPPPAARCPQGQVGQTALHQYAMDYFIDFAMKSPEYLSWMRNADLFEVGVFNGISLCHTVQTFLQKGMPFRNLYGFDSFEGLPQADGIFSKGSWSAKQNLSPQSSIAEVVDQVSRNIHYSNAHFVQGFYDKSMTDELPRKMGMKKPFWINIDCDLYESTQVALDWVLRNDLVELGKTHIYFDDIEHYRARGKKGEHEAWNEAQAKYHVKATPLLKTGAGDGYFFRIDGNRQEEAIRSG